MSSERTAGRTWPDQAALDTTAEDDTWVPPGEQERSIRTDLIEIFRHELWPYRGLGYELMRRDIRVRYKQAAMGFAWAVLMPALIVLAGALVRYAMAFVGGRDLSAQEIAGMAIKAVPWSFFVGALGFATTSLTGNPNLVMKIYFPREVLPIAATSAQAFDSSIGALTFLIVCPLLGVVYGVSVLWAPVIAICLYLFTAGLALLVSCANLFFRDVKYLVQVMLTFGIFFTPVFFEPEMFGPIGARLMMLNPVGPLLEGLRLSVVYNHNLLEPMVVVRNAAEVLAWSPWYLAYSGACAAVALLAGLVIFHRAESKFAEYV